jgi:hypothetical protein
MRENNLLATRTRKNINPLIHGFASLKKGSGMYTKQCRASNALMRYHRPMKAKTTDEYATFSDALRKVIQVSPKEIKDRIAAKKSARTRRKNFNAKQDALRASRERA